MSQPTETLMGKTDDTGTPAGEGGEQEVKPTEESAGGSPPAPEGGEGQKPAEDKPAEGEGTSKDQKPKATDPKDYELSLAEGSNFADGVLDEMREFAKEQGLTQEQTQAALELSDSAISAYQKEKIAEWDGVVAGWRSEIEKDAEMGGDKLNDNLVMVKKALKAFFPEDLPQQLEETGYGNHPGLFSGLLRIGKALEEAQLVTPQAMEAKPKSAAQVLFGNVAKKE